MRMIHTVHINATGAVIRDIIGIIKGRVQIIVQEAWASLKKRGKLMQWGKRIFKFAHSKAVAIHIALVVMIHGGEEVFRTFQAIFLESTATLEQAILDSPALVVVGLICFALYTVGRIPYIQWTQRRRY